MGGFYREITQILSLRILNLFSIQAVLRIGSTAQPGMTEGGGMAARLKSDFVIQIIDKKRILVSRVSLHSEKMARTRLTV